MSIHTIASETLKQRRMDWSVFHPISDLEELLALQEATTDHKVKAELEAYIVRRKRHMRGLFETLEKQGETAEKLAVAAAAAGAVAANWVAKTGFPLAAELRNWLEACLYVAGAVGWLVLFSLGRTRCHRARQLLAELGKAD